MSIASFAVPAALAPFQDFFRWFGHVSNPDRAINSLSGFVSGSLAHPAPRAVQRPVQPPAFLRHRSASQPALVGRLASVNRSPAVGRPPSDHRLASAANSTASLTANSAVSSPSSRVLRVVRMMEAGQPRANVGRMVISGRMADVCAELDRLVAKETVLH